MFAQEGEVFLFIKKIVKVSCNYRVQILGEGVPLKTEFYGLVQKTTLRSSKVDLTALVFALVCTAKNIIVIAYMYTVHCLQNRVKYKIQSIF